MKKGDLKKRLKEQNKKLKRHKEVLKSYKKMIEEYDDVAKRLKKSLKKFENLLEEIEVEEAFTDEELDLLLNEFETENGSSEEDTAEEEDKNRSQADN